MPSRKLQSTHQICSSDAFTNFRSKKTFTNQLHTELLALGEIDGTQHWEDAVWLPVRRFDCKINPVPTKKIFLQTNKEELFVLGWCRIVLFGTDIGQNAPLVFYDMNGGLQQQDAELARSHFSSLKTWQFKLDRHSTESNTTGCLHLDKWGSQRMEMLGIRSRGRTSITPQTTNAHILRLPIGQVISTCMWYIMSMKNSRARMFK
jgi:hypothetical protein